MIQDSGEVDCKHGILCCRERLGELECDSVLLLVVADVCCLEALRLLACFCDDFGIFHFDVCGIQDDLFDALFDV